MNLRSRLLTAVVTCSVLAAGLGFFLVMGESPGAARLRLLVDVILLAALGGAVVALTRSPLERREELLDAMRALARGAREKRLDYERFGDLEDVARAYNELAAALTEHDDPNLGPIKARPRERPPWLEPNASDHPELGEVRVISKKEKAALAEAAEKKAEQRAEKRAEKRAPESKKAEPSQSKTAEAEAPKRPADAKPKAKQEASAKAPARDEPSSDAPAEDEAHSEDEDAAEEVPASERETMRPGPSAAAVDNGRPLVAAPNNDTAIDERPLAEEGATTPPAVAAAREEREGVAASAATDTTLPPFDMRALFQEFVEAKRAHDEDTSDLEYDAFAETLEDEMERLLEAHRCRAVRFEVRVQDGEVSLLPRLIR